MIICILNQKGGVGKTTTAINLSVSLAQWGQETLLVDVDPQGNATSGLGVRPAAGPSLYEALVGSIESTTGIDDNRQPTRPARSADTTLPLPFVQPGPVEHLHVVGASTELAGADIELAGNQHRDNLRAVLSRLEERFPLIVLDTPPSLSLLTVNSLVAGDKLIIPIQCEYFALEGLGQLLRTLELIRKNLNPHLEIMGLLRTMYDARLGLSAQVSQELEAHFSQLVFNTIIPRNVRLAEAPSHGLPIALYDRRSPGANAYRRLGLEVLQRAGMNPTDGHLLKKR